jgi:hypothetical protein
VPKFFLFAILSFVLFACQIEVAQPAVNKELRVASNFITKKQQGFFRAWQKKSGIKISFLRLNPQQIRQLIKKQPWNPGFDVVWLNGLEAYSKLSDTPFQANYLDFAQIPIGLSFVPDSIDQVTNFIELSQTNLWAAADDQSYNILKAHLDFAFRNRAKSKKKRDRYQQIISGLKDRKLAFNGADQYHTNMLLSRYDTYLHELKPADKKQRIIYPQFFRYSGVSDRSTFSIVRQASNYTNAKLFFAFLNKQLRKNAKFCQRLGFKKITPKEKLISSKTLLPLLKK